MTNKPKYEKLVKGERKAVRKAGARKEAKSGRVAEIYTAQKGGGLVTSGKSNKGSASTNQGSVTLQGRTSKDKIKATIGSPEEKAAAFERQTQINQAGFERTRLGSRLKKKAEKVAAKKNTTVKRSTAVVKSKRG